MCNLHFNTDQVERTANGKKKLKPGTVPTIFGETRQNITEAEQPLYDSPY